MASFVQSVIYVAINIDDTTSNGFYVIKFISEAFMLKNNTIIYGQVISAGELVVKAKYIFSVQENTNWYCKQKPLKQTIIVPTRTILHPCLDVIIIRYLQDIPTNILSGMNQKHKYKDIQLL